MSRQSLEIKILKFGHPHNIEPVDSSGDSKFSLCFIQDKNLDKLFLLSWLNMRQDWRNWYLKFEIIIIVGFNISINLFHPKSKDIFFCNSDIDFINSLNSYIFQRKSHFTPLTFIIKIVERTLSFEITNRGLNIKFEVNWFIFCFNFSRFFYFMLNWHFKKSPMNSIEL